MVAAALFAASCGAPAAAPSASPVAVATASPSRSPSPTPAPTRSLLPQISGNTTVIQLTKIPVPGAAGKTLSVDQIVVDQAAHLMYVADRTTNGVDVFDVSTPTAKFVKTIDTGSGPNGLVIAKPLNKLFAGLNDSNVAVIDLVGQTVAAKVNTGGKNRADELDYDPKDNKLYVANGDDGFITVLDPKTNAILKKIDNLGEGLEQPHYDAVDGMMYLVSSDQNLILQFDPSKDVLVKKIDPGVKCNPMGIDINPTTHRALIGCGNRATPFALDWDMASAKVVTQFDQTGSGDVVLYDAKVDRFFFAASNFNRGPVLSIFTGNPIKFVTNVPTAVGSHAVAYDETNNVVYLQDQLPNEGALYSFVLPK